MTNDDDLVNKIQSLRERNNRSSYSIEIDEPRINGYKGYVSIEFDLTVVKRYLRALQAIDQSVKSGAMDQDELTQTLQRSLYTSSIIAYARCFTETRGRGVQLDASKCFKGEEDLKAAHQRLMEVRHQHLAHAGLSDNEFVYAGVNFDIIGSSVELTLAYDITLKVSHSNAETVEFIKVVDHLVGFVKEKKERSATRFIDGLSLDEKNALLGKRLSARMRRHLIDSSIQDDAVKKS